jgi:hypothetical protein
VGDGREDCVERTRELTSLAHVHRGQGRGFREVGSDLGSKVLQLKVLVMVVDDGNHLDNVGVFAGLEENLLGVKRWPFEGTGEVVKGRHDAAVALKIPQPFPDPFREPQFDINVLHTPLDRPVQVFEVQIGVIHGEPTILVGTSRSKNYGEFGRLAEKHHLPANIIQAWDGGKLAIAKGLFEQIHSDLNSIGANGEDVEVR